MQAFEINQIIQRQVSSGNPYLEFLRVPDLSLGLYVLPVDGVDPQQPHSEDEVYYMISGKAVIKVGDEDRPVSAGAIVYVPKDAEHFFHSIEEELKCLVFFAPAESSN